MTSSFDIIHRHVVRGRDVRISKHFPFTEMRCLTDFVESSQRFTLQEQTCICMRSCAYGRYDVLLGQKIPCFPICR